MADACISRYFAARRSFLRLVHEFLGSPFARAAASFLAATTALVVAGCASTPMTVDNRIVIDRPVDEVFAYVADFENVPRWNYYVVSVTKGSSGPIGIGTVFRQRRRSDAQSYRVTSWALDERITVETLPPERRALRTLTFVATKRGTEVVDHWEIDLDWPARCFAAAPVRAGVAENLGKLKELLERGETTLQDGRHSSRGGGGSTFAP